MPFQSEFADIFLEYTFSAISTLSDANISEGKTVVVDKLKMTDLPKVMRNMGWTVAPRLMERWFESDAFVLEKNLRDKYYIEPLDIPEAHYDDKIVTMDWALSFKRVKNEYENILKNKLTPAAIALLQKRIINAQLFDDGSRLGNIGMSARELNAHCQIQTQPLGSRADTIDDMYGSIGLGMLQLAVVGEVQRGISDDAFRVDHFGVYLKDVYEFNGFQFLGCWTKEKTFGKAEILNRAAAKAYRLANPVADVAVKLLKTDQPVFHVHNHDFRNYLEKHGKGGDFIIYSDVKWSSGDGLTIPLGELLRYHPGNIPALFRGSMA